MMEEKSKIYMSVINLLKASILAWAVSIAFSAIAAVPLFFLLNILLTRYGYQYPEYFDVWVALSLWHIGRNILGLE